MALTPPIMGTRGKPRYLLTGAKAQTFPVADKNFDVLRKIGIRVKLRRSPCLRYVQRAKLTVKGRYAGYVLFFGRAVGTGTDSVTSAQGQRLMAE